MICKKDIVLFFFPHRPYVLDICQNCLNEAILTNIQNIYFLKCSPLKGRACASQIIIITNYVFVSSVGITKVNCSTQNWLYCITFKIMYTMNAQISLCIDAICSKCLLSTYSVNARIKGSNLFRFSVVLFFEGSKQFWQNSHKMVFISPTRESIWKRMNTFQGDTLWEFLHPFLNMVFSKMKTFAPKWVRGGEGRGGCNFFFLLEGHDVQECKKEVKKLIIFSCRNLSVASNPFNQFCLYVTNKIIIRCLKRIWYAL